MAGLTCDMLVEADFRERDTMWVVYDYRGRVQSWYGLQGNIGWEVSERKDHMVAQIIEKYIIGTKYFFFLLTMYN